VLVAIGIDEAYVAPACRMLRSLARSAGPARRDVRVVALMPADTSAGSGARLRAHAASLGLPLEMRPVAEDLSGFELPRCPTNYLTRAAYLRLFAAELLPEHRRLVYLDVDLVVMRDVTELGRTDLGDAPVAAVRDGCLPRLRAALARSGVEVAGAAADRPYFNSGVMVVDLDRWRRERIGPRARALLGGIGTPLEHVDQDALNLVIDGRWTELDRRWNVFPMGDPGWAGPRPPDHSDAAQARLEREAFVLHFTGRRKPWQADYPASRGRDRYRRLTAWDPAGAAAMIETPGPDTAGGVRYG